MSVERLVDKQYRQIIQEAPQAGRAILAARYPDEFEYYLFALELRTGSDNEVTDRLIFTVNPSDISYNNQKLTAIQKTTGGVTTMVTPSFVPKSINLSGTFGRRFRLIPDFRSSEGLLDGKISWWRKTFASAVKSGYGMVKELEKIVDRSVELDTRNQSRKMIFYNFALNHIFFVEPTVMRISQNEKESRMWRYQLSLSAVGDARTTSGFNYRERVDAERKFQSDINEISDELRQFAFDELRIP